MILRGNVGENHTDPPTSHAAQIGLYTEMHFQIRYSFAKLGPILALSYQSLCIHEYIS